MEHARNSYLMGSVNWPKFGARIKREIEKTKMSYRDLAEDLNGPSHPTLNRIARGKPCSVEMYLWLCREFSIQPEWAYTHLSVTTGHRRDG